MVTIAQLQSWSPATLSAIADVLIKRKRGLEDLQDEIDAAKPPASWQQGNSAAARTQHTMLRDRLNDLAAEVSRVAAEYDIAAAEIKAAKAELEQWEETARAKGYDVSSEGGDVVVRDPTPPVVGGRAAPSVPVEPVTGPTPEEVATGLAAALKRAQAADSALARALSAAHLDTVDGGSVADAGARGQGAAMTLQEQIDYVRTADGIPPEVMKYISSEAQQALADEVAGDIHGEEHDPDRGTVTILQNLQGQAPFAHRLFTTVSADEFADTIDEMSAGAYPVGGRGAVSVTPISRDLYKDFLNAAGATLATYTKGEGAYAPPADFADRFFNEIVDDGNHENAAALTLLVRAGGEQTSFDPAFLRDVTGQVYEWERDHDGDPVWGPRDSGIRDPNREGTAYSGGSAKDGLANLLGGMQHTPKAAQDFFTGNYDGSSESLDERMDYLVGGGDGRTWDASDGSDEGDGLGRALEAATVGEATRTPVGDDIASKFLQNVAKYGGETDGMVDDKWHIGPAMTDSLGTILSGYSGDLYQELAGGSMEHLDLDGRDDLKQILAELGRPEDKTGLETLTAAMVLQSRAEYAETLAAVRGPHTLENLIVAGVGGQQETSGRVLGEFLQDSLSMASDDDKTDAARAALLSKAIDVTAGFIPGAGHILGDSASHLAKATLDTMTNEALAALKDSVRVAPDTDLYLDGAVDDLEVRLRYHAFDALIEGGYLEPGPAQRYELRPVPPEVLVRGPAPPRPSSRGWRWRRHRHLRDDGLRARRSGTHGEGVGRVPVVEPRNWHSGRGADRRLDVQANLHRPDHLNGSEAPVCSSSTTICSWPYRLQPFLLQAVARTPALIR